MKFGFKMPWTRRAEQRAAALAAERARMLREAEDERLRQADMLQVRKMRQQASAPRPQPYRGLSPGTSRSQLREDMATRQFIDREGYGPDLATSMLLMSMLHEPCEAPSRASQGVSQAQAYVPSYEASSSGSSSYDSSSSSDYSSPSSSFD